MLFRSTPIDEVEDEVTKGETVEPDIKIDTENGYVIDPNTGEYLDPDTYTPIDDTTSDLDGIGAVIDENAIQINTQTP